MGILGRLNTRFLISLSTIVCVAGCTGSSSSPPNTGAGGSPSVQASCPTPTITAFPGVAGRVRPEFSLDGTQITYDQPIMDSTNSNYGCYDVYVAKSDGSAPRCLTCGNTTLVHNKGLASWYPNNQYVVFLGEKTTHSGPYCIGYTNPGGGFYDDIYVYNLNTNTLQSLITIPLGSLHPRFSPDGKSLLWSKLVSTSTTPAGSEAGNWELHEGDISITNGTMSYTNDRVLIGQSQGNGIIESHGFLPDGSGIVFSSNLGYGVNLYTAFDNYRANLDGTNPVRLTNQYYNEHAQFAPSMNHFVRMSSAWGTSHQEQNGTEYFIANPDGSNSCQITHFNTAGFAETQSWPTVVGKLTWMKDSTKFVGYSFNRSATDTYPDYFLWTINFGTPQ